MNKDFIKRRIIKRVGFIIGGVILAAALAFLFGFIVLYLWNWLMPEIFGLPTISYIQAWGLVLLSHILFKSGGPGGKSHHGGRGRHFKGKCQPNDEMRRRFTRHDEEETSTEIKE